VLALLLVCFAAAVPAVADPVDETLKTTLEAAYRRFLDAAASGDRGRLRDAISRQSFDDAAVTLAAMGREFDAGIVRSFAAENPDLSRARVIETRRGDGAAALVYVRDVRTPEGAEPQVAFTFVRFTRDEGEWRYDALLDF
jgi:hypothetical protein